MGTPAHAARAGANPRTLESSINYAAPMSVRPRFYANDHSRDVLALDPRSVRIEDARACDPAPSLEREGIVLVRHRSAVADFRDTPEVAASYPLEIERLVLELARADAVVVTGTGVLRFAERSPDCGRLNNSHPARFIHVDCSAATAAQFAERSRPADRAGRVRRFAHYNIWRTFSPPPQDVPLAVCDARTVESRDLVPADAVFDVSGQPEWSFEGLVVRFNPGHRWLYFSNMTRDEALLFKTSDSSPEEPRQVPHSAFDDPSCPPDVVPRASIEMRATAYWFE
ncbi:MAG TPA: CmcJ/NvfI family oxidoreductase [Steroidobacteraceae bacterium]|nr:CmcJ/NvfI family oxidoreductase [Steroidobacteraceae bacterium]